MSNLTKGELLYDGKAKRLYGTTDPDKVIMEFKDDATAFNGVKHAVMQDKGRINCAITVHLFEQLASRGIDSHMIEQLNDNELLCWRVEIIPVEIVVRNFIAGSLARRYGFEEGAPLDAPLVELFYKSDELNDPLMSDDIALCFGWARQWELDCMKEKALEVNAFLNEFWGSHNLDLVDFKLEYGRQNGRIVLADEITPDGSRIWEKGTRRRFDKDVFRRDLGDLMDTYKALYARIFGHSLENT